MSARLTLGLAALLVVAPVILLVGASPLFPYAFPPLILATVRHRMLPAFLSPVWIVVAILWLLGITGWLTYPLLQGAAGGGLEINLDPEIADQTAVLIGVSVSFLALGGALGVSLRPKLPKIGGLEPVNVDPKYLPWLLLGALIPIGMILPEMPIQYLFERPYYQMALDVPAVSVFGHQLAVASVAILGFLFAKQRGPVRLVVVLAAVTYLSLFLAYGSRRLAMIPILFAVGAYAATMSRKAGRWLVAAGILSALMLPIPLFVRGQASHGLIPYLEALPTIFENGPSWETTLNNIMVFFPITGLTAYAIPSIPSSTLLMELNPLPGDWVGWYDVASNLGLNRATPYSGLGEMGNAGWAWVAPVWIIIGLVLSVLERTVFRALANGQQVLAVAMVGLAGLFAVTVTQYNFRNAQRDLMYALIIAAFVTFFANKKNVAQPMPVETGFAEHEQGTLRKVH